MYSTSNKSYIRNEFAVRKLGGLIDPKQSKFILKNNTLILSLTKSVNKHWNGINYQKPLPSTGEKQKQPEKSDDPNASLVNLMKKMYDEGDDNMKRTLAETWSKQREIQEKEVWMKDYHHLDNHPSNHLIKNLE